MKKLSKKVLAGIGAGVVALVIIIALAVVFTFRVDAVQAQEIALQQAGGGEIISQSVETEGLLSEYQYVITNGDNWYEVSIDGFGNVEEIESGTGQYRD